MTSQWPTYRAANGDPLDDRFFNDRFRSLDNRLVAIELSLGTIQDGSSTLVREAMEVIRATSDQALVDFNNSLAETMSIVQSAQQNINALEDELNDILASIGEQTTIDANAGAKIQIKRSDETGFVPSFASMDYGELVLNYADKKLFFRGPSDSVVSVDLDTSASRVREKLLTVDGSGSGIDADLFRGNAPSAFATANHTHDGYMPAGGGTMNGPLGIVTSSSGPALKVTQTGIGDAFQVDHDGAGSNMTRVDASGFLHCDGGAY